MQGKAGSPSARATITPRHFYSRSNSKGRRDDRLPDMKSGLPVRYVTRSLALPFWHRYSELGASGPRGSVQLHPVSFGWDRTL